jgi:prepilin signal peptidase PulO-like enzyme (type II secretory pathway)
LPSTPTFPVFLAGVVTTSTYYAVALSVLALIVTWGLLVAISVIGSGRKQSGAAPVDFDQTDQLMANANAPALQTADSAA